MVSAQVVTAGLGGQGGFTPIPASKVLSQRPGVQAMVSAQVVTPGLGGEGGFTPIPASSSCLKPQFLGTLPFHLGATQTHPEILSEACRDLLSK